MLRDLKEKLSLVVREDNKISPDDFQELMLDLGVSITAESVNHMIYEVDELLDGMIS